MTTNIAALLQIGHERGAIAIGQFADIIAISGNPLDDVSALQDMRFVMKEGRIIRHE